MIGIRYKETDLNLGSDFVIDWQLDDDIFDFDNIGEGHSWPVRIPKEGNHQLFFFAGEPEIGPIHKTYDDFYITRDGNVWWEVSFRHRKNTEFHIEGTLSLVDSPLLTALQSGIRTYITAKFGIVDELEPVYPELHFYNSPVTSSDDQIVNYNDEGSGSPVVTIPCWYYLDILRHVMENIGMTLIDNFSISGELFQKLILIHNRSVPSAVEERNVSDYVTDIKVSDLLSIALTLSASSVSLRINRKTIEVNDHVRVTKKIAVDLAGKVASYETDEIASRKFEISYPLSNDSVLTAQIVPEGVDKGEYDTLALFEAETGLTPGDYAFVKRENAYYRAIDNKGSTEIVFYTYAFPNLIVGDDSTEATPIEIPVLPTFFDNHLYREIQSSQMKVIESPTTAGRVRIIDLPGDFFPRTDEEIKLEEDHDNVAKYTEIYHEVTAINFANKWVELDLDFFEDVNLSRIFVRLPIDQFMPVIGEKINHHAADLAPDTSTARIAIYYGTQDDTQGNPYAMAAPGNYSSDVTKLGSFTLNTVGEDSIILTKWQTLSAFLGQSEIVKLFTNLSEVDIIDVYRQKILRWEKGLLRLKSINSTLTQRGIEGQEIEGYRI